VPGLLSSRGVENNRIEPTKRDEQSGRGPGCYLRGAGGCEGPAQLRSKCLSLSPTFTWSSLTQSRSVSGTVSLSRRVVSRLTTSRARRREIIQNPNPPSHHPGEATTATAAAAAAAPGVSPPRPPCSAQIRRSSGCSRSPLRDSPPPSPLLVTSFLFAARARARCSMRREPPARGGFV
jgi:hypothetical protein